MDVLSNILSRMRLAGTLYFRTSFTSPWSIRVPAFENVSRFHFAHKGRCLVRVANAKDLVILEQGDLVIITRGAGHTLFCDPSTEGLAVQLDEVVRRSGFSGHGTLVFGDTGSNLETQLVCGHFAFDANAHHPLMDALPSHIHIRNYGDTIGNWMENTLKVIGAEAGRDQLGADLIAHKMSEIIYAQALRTYLTGEGAQLPILAGFADRNISRALKAFHDDPAASWNLDGLAEIAGMSRTSFANRFASTMTMSPMAYVTQWRMQIARQQLAESDDAMIEVAEAVGYGSEAAFGRAFKKQFEVAPAAFRRAARRQISAYA